MFGCASSAAILASLAHPVDVIDQDADTNTPIGGGKQPSDEEFPGFVSVNNIVLNVEGLTGLLDQGGARDKCINAVVEKAKSGLASVLVTDLCGDLAQRSRFGGLQCSRWLAWMFQINGRTSGSQACQNHGPQRGRLRPKVFHAQMNASAFPYV